MLTHQLQSIMQAEAEAEAFSGVWNQRKSSATNLGLRKMSDALLCVDICQGMRVDHLESLYDERSYMIRSPVSYIQSLYAREALKVPAPLVHHYPMGCNH